MSSELNLNKDKWKSVKLGELAEEISVRVENPADSKFDKFVGLENFVSGDLKIKKYETTENLVSAAKQFQSGDILLARRNAYLRRASLVEFSGICSGDAFVLRDNSDHVIPGFLAFVVNSNNLWDYANANAAGTMSKRVKWRDLANYEFLLPPKEQQAEIANLLWALDESIQMSKVNRIALNSLYTANIEKKLFLKTAKKRYLKDLGNVIRGVNYKPEDLLNNYDLDSCIVLRANNISESKLNFDDIKIISKEKIKKDQFLKKNDFIICMSNGSKQLVGKAAKNISKDKNASVGSFCSIMRPSSDISADILQHIFSSLSYRYSINRALSGSTINNLKPSDIEGLTFRINDNTQELNTTLTNLNYIVSALKSSDQKISASNSLQESLINQIF